MFSFFKKNKEETISRTTPGFEETGERKTPKMGIVLLLIMFVVGVFFGWRALDDLARIPTPPVSLSSCSNEFQRYGGYQSSTRVSPAISPTRYSEYDNDGYYPGYGSYPQKDSCQFNDLEKKYGIPALFGKRDPIAKELSDAYQNEASLNNQLNGSRRQRRDLENQYGIGLQEQGVNLPKKIFPVTPEVQHSILNLRNEETRLQGLLTESAARRSVLQKDISAVNLQIAVAYKPVLEEQNRRLRWYELKIFLLQFFVITPFFLFALRWYLRLLGKNSPYAIIWVGVGAVLGVLLAKILLVWFWGLFLARIIEVLMRWFAQFEAIRSLIFYLGMLLSFLLFGGAVYQLQKRIFDPRRVAIRRFRAKQCPHCQTNLDLSGANCPNCGNRVREQCPSCKQYRFVGLPFCPSCGAKSG